MVASSYKRKEYTLGRRTVYVQGDEPAALDYLTQDKQVKPSQIKCGTKSKIPVIWFFKEEVKHRYYPDMHIPHLNQVVEVKSTYTYKVSKDDVIRKANAVIEHGYHFRLIVVKGEDIVHDKVYRRKIG